MINVSGIVTQKSLTSTALTEDSNETVIQSFRATNFLFYADALFSQVVIVEAGEQVMPNILVNWSLYLRIGQTVNFISGGMNTTNPLMSVSKGAYFPNAAFRFKIKTGHDLILETRTVNSGVRNVTLLATIVYGIVSEEGMMLLNAIEDEKEKNVKQIQIQQLQPKKLKPQQLQLKRIRFQKNQQPQIRKIRMPSR